jgi:hypothetical protein
MKILNRHSGAGRNPVESNKHRKAIQNSFVRYAGYIYLLDSGLRRNDAASK